MNIGTRLIVVSNRLPITFGEQSGRLSMEPSCGGLVTALQPLLRGTSGAWIGWTGTEQDSRIPSALKKLSSESNCAYVPIFLTAGEKACFYHGCSNEIIWPLFHDLQSHCNFDPDYWDVYCQVNEKFADAVEENVHRGDIVWVHDYHLMMLADALRARDFRGKLAYFHHIPFPPPDIFEKLPWRCEILRGLLQYSAVGFQTLRDRLNFIASVRRCLKNVRVRKAGERMLVQADDLCAAVGAFPISIDFEEFERQARDPAVTDESAALQKSLAGCQVILGVDRLDYTKGIPERLLAFRKLLERQPDLRGRITMIQVVVPSREDIPKYRDLKLLIERLVSQINGEFGMPGWMPIYYLHRTLSRPQLIAYYQSADVALVTSLKDGMNLVAKEFCACRTDGGGTLVLSEFCGAANELKSGALMVNPYDAEGVAAAVNRALRMSSREQRIRMEKMRRHIRRHDVFRWCRDFCSQLGAFRIEPIPVPVEEGPVVQSYAASGD